MSEEERALVPSIQSHTQRYLICEKPWLTSATVPDVSVQCTLMNKTEVICIFTCCLKGKLNEPKCMFPWYVRERAHRERIKLLVRAWEGSWVVPGETKNQWVKVTCWSPKAWNPVFLLSPSESFCYSCLKWQCCFFIPWPLGGALVSLYCFLISHLLFAKRCQRFIYFSFFLVFSRGIF